MSFITRAEAEQMLVEPDSKWVIVTDPYGNGTKWVTTREDYMGKTAREIEDWE